MGKIYIGLVLKETLGKIGKMGIMVKCYFWIFEAKLPLLH